MSAPLPEPKPPETKSDSPTLLDHCVSWGLIALAGCATLGAVLRVVFVDHFKGVDQTSLLYLGVGGALLLFREIKTLSFGDYKIELNQLKKKTENTEVVARDAKAEADKALMLTKSLEAGTTSANQILTELRLASEKAQAAAQQANDAAKRANDALSFGVFDQAGSRRAFGVSASSETAIQPGTASNDPWKGQFGELSERNNRRLYATVLPIANRPDWFSLTLVVESTQQVTNPLTGSVTFYLHPSFVNNRPTVNVGPNGRAELHLTAWGAFTVGAVADGGHSLLELDLSRLPEAPEQFRSR